MLLPRVITIALWANVCLAGPKPEAKPCELCGCGRISGGGWSHGGSCGGSSEFIGGDFGSYGSYEGSYIGGGYSGIHQQCTPFTTTQVEHTVKPVLHESYSSVPVVHKSVRHEQECRTRAIPVVQNEVYHESVNHIKHVPIVERRSTPIVESDTRTVPVIKKRIVPIVQKYVQHVPINVNKVRHVERPVVRNVPVVHKSYRPVVRQHVKHIPVVECSTRPVVQHHVDHVPVKHLSVSNVVESHLRPVHGSVCTDVPIHSSGGYHGGNVGFGDGGLGYDGGFGYDSGFGYDGGFGRSCGGICSCCC